MQPDAVDFDILSGKLCKMKYQELQRYRDKKI